jgi:hypothetical protein
MEIFITIAAILGWAAFIPLNLFWLFLGYAILKELRLIRRGEQ